MVSTSTPPTINVPEKIRYAKWKAADIAKAFREGRKPTPGGAGEQSQPEEEPALAPVTNEEPATPPAIQRSVSPPGHITDRPGQLERVDLKHGASHNQINVRHHATAAAVARHFLSSGARRATGMSLR